MEPSQSNFNDFINFKNKDGNNDYYAYLNDRVKLTKELTKNIGDSKYTPLNDGNAPWAGVTSFGATDTPGYYYQSKVSSRQYWKMARFTPLANRATYGVSEDTWNNNFKIEIIGESKIENIKINRLLDRHNRVIQWWTNMRKATGYRNEQGEAIAVIFREGVSMEDLKKPADINKPVVRIEGINLLDYSKLNIGDKGIPTKYRICFYQEGRGMPSYEIHTSNVLRLKYRDLEYDEYEGTSVLQPIFGDLTIAENIKRAIGELAYRTGGGKPLITIKEGAEQNLTEIRNIIGNPTMQSFIIAPKAYIDDIKMLGAGQSTIDLPALLHTIIEGIASNIEIPMSILNGDSIGVEGAQISDRLYFYKIDKQHTALEPDIHKYFSVDPYIRDEIIKGRDYKIDWGLRLVMSEEDMAKFKHSLSLLSQSLSNICTFNECREVAMYPAWEKAVDSKKMEEIYGYSAEDMGQMLCVNVASLMGQMIAEQQAETAALNNSEEELGGDGGNNPDNLRKMPGQPDSGKNGGYTQMQKDDKKKAAKEVADAIYNYEELYDKGATAFMLNIAPNTYRKSVRPTILRRIENDKNN